MPDGRGNRFSLADLPADDSLASPLVPVPLSVCLLSDPAVRPTVFGYARVSLSLPSSFPFSLYFSPPFFLLPLPLSCECLAGRLRQAKAAGLACFLSLACGSRRLLRPLTARSCPSPDHTHQPHHCCSPDRHAALLFPDMGHARDAAEFDPENEIERQNEDDDGEELIRD